ncbi:MAG: V-type ATPase subunit [Candidatus ainarchaeum sp.]|nr:V-type ATPase subunit [Candidatus ainarchaeum sp.]
MELPTGFLEKAEKREKKHWFFPISFKRKSTSGYAYTNTRVRVMKTKLLGKNDFRKMMNMSFSEIARYMQETEYSKEISELATRYTNANLIEYSLNKNLENTFNRILAFSMKASEEQVKLYLKKFDILNAKTFLRGRFSGQGEEAIISQFICAGSLGRKFFENAVKKSSNLDEAIMQLKGTEYFDIAKKFNGNLSKIEDALDKHYYRDVLEKAEPELVAFLMDEIKVKNTLNLLRAKKTGIKMEKIENESETKLALPKTDDGIENRVFLKKFLLERGNKMAREFKRNVRPVLGYLIAKENEISNIRIIVRGKSSNLPAGLIEEQLVI